MLLCSHLATDKGSGDEAEANIDRVPGMALKPLCKWSNTSEDFNTNSDRGNNEESTKVSDNFSLTPMECLEVFFTDKIIQAIAEMSNIYTLQRNHTLNLTLEEVKAYIAILLPTGYMTPKYVCMFWEIKFDTHEIVSNSMRRNRLLKIQ
ncbi:hypothetical protein ILUMI_13490 [Ignelater luminosus]|uniref:PiggyBac transposable element-derived protein domain-containing protein n=1 Tax=Ignelater luminosus TaxID=2038154 RepID=A0A8K0CWM7_IGNLU|nr:hypothetical protein ILUMI_13490 [Ignelater luminosus]